jgi:hypothetical protein
VTATAAGTANAVQNAGELSRQREGELLVVGELDAVHRTELGLDRDLLGFDDLLRTDHVVPAQQAADEVGALLGALLRAPAAVRGR